MKKNEILELIKNQILFFDGGTGSVLQGIGLKPGELPETWNITNPEKIIKLHLDYFLSGCNIIKTNTFGANPNKFIDSKFNLEQIISSALQNAKYARSLIEDKSSEYSKSEFANSPHLIALDIGPCGKLLEPLGDLSFENAVKLFSQTIEIGLKNGADLILIETMNDCYEAKSAIIAAKEVIEKLGNNYDVPIFVTTVYDETARSLTGSNIETMCTILEGLGVDALGMNCSLGPIQMKNFINDFTKNTKLPIIVNPNAGLPRSENGKTVYDISPQDFANIVSNFVANGVSIVGGCCGTTPEHIKLLVKKINEKNLINKNKIDFFINQKTENDINKNSNTSKICSNTKVVKIGKNEKPVLIGERINPTGKKRFKQALRENDIQYILQEGIKQEENGANILDVNVGLPEIDETKMMKNVIKELQSVTDLPLQIDTSNPDTMEQALRIYNGKALINSVNGKQEVMEKIFPLVKKYGGCVVALTLDENGIPETAEGRIEIAKKILTTAQKFGIDKNEIIFDPLTMAVSSDDKAGIETLKSVKNLTEKFNAKTILGISNISFGLPQREILTSTFFTMALTNGLSCAIMNPNSTEIIKAYNSFCTLSGKDNQCTQYINFAENILPQQNIYQQISTQQNLQTNNSNLQTSNYKIDSIEYAIIKGLKEQTILKTKELLKEKSELQIINENLIPALDVVGKGFEQKKIYLPQLLMSAEAVKAGFSILKDNLISTGKEEEPKGEVVIATVKGDIHDIGKNIVKVLLENYSFKVYDLGKDVEPQSIVDLCIEKNIKLVGLSALMTTTVPAMEETIKLLKDTCPDCKVCVGGAVLTQEYANMIGASYYAKDALDTVKYAQNIFTN